MEITDENFDQLIKKENIAVVGFGAPWCGNCRRFLPVLEETVDSLKLPFYRLIVDESPETTERYEVNPVPVRYDVRGVPTVIVFESGQEKGRVVGDLPQKDLARKLKDICG